MLNRKKSLICIPLLLLAAANAHAALESLTLHQAVSRALEFNTTVRDAREREKEAGNIHSVRVSQLFPSISAELAATHRKDGLLTGNALFDGERYNRYEGRLLLIQPLYRGGALWSSMKAASQERRLRELDREIAERDVTADVISTFYSVLVNQRKVENFTATQKVLTDSLQTARRRQRIGRGQTLDVLQIQTQVALLESRIAQAQAGLKTSVVTLMNLLADRETHQVELKGSFETKGLDALLERIRKEPYRVLEIERVGVEEEQLDSQTTVSMAKYWPQLDFVGSYGRAAFDRSDLFNEYANAWSIGLELKIPIFNSFASIAERHQYQSQMRQVLVRQTRVKDRSALEESRAMHDLQAAQRTIKASEEAYDLARSSVREAQRNYQYATIDYLQFLAVQQSLLDAQTSRDEAQLGYVQALSRYLIATGHSIQDLVKVLGGSSG